MSACTVITHWTRAVATLAAVIILVIDVRPATADVQPAIGPGPEMRLTVPGSRPRAVIVAAQQPVIVISWAAEERPGGYDVYIAVSTDNGDSFGAPLRVTAENTLAMAEGPDLQVTFRPAASRSPSDPLVRIGWRVGKNGARRAREGSISRRAVTLGRVISADPIPAALAASCRANGEVVLESQEPSREPAVVNPGARWANCSGGTFSEAITDRRRWMHVAWTSGAPAATSVVYAASRNGRQFGVVTLGLPGVHTRPRIAVDDKDTALVTWQTGGSGSERILMQQILPHHANVRLLPLVTISGPEPARAPSIASIRGGVVIAWIAGSGRTSWVAAKRVGLDAICDPSL